MPDGKIMHSEIAIGDSVVMVTDEFPDWGALAPQSLGGTPVSLNLYVRTATPCSIRRVAAGATVSRPLAGPVLGRPHGLAGRPVRP